MTVRVLLVAALAVVAGALVAAGAAGSALGGPDAPPAGSGAPTRAAAPARYHLSLGDSLARGVQPAPDGRPARTREGYGPIVARSRRLALVELGCPGETIVTMAGSGSRCRYRAGSQLRAAEAFLRRHRGRVALVTLSIGGNDVLRCGSVSGVDPVCASARAFEVPPVAGALARRLRRAGGGVRVVGLTYSNPFLGLYLRGEEGRRAALASAPLAASFNSRLRRSYSRAGAGTADVARAFGSSQLDRLESGPGGTAVPVAVARLCRLSWACAPPPRGPDIHPNAEGYRVIAREVLRAAR
ncbi:MAG: SGNH/GDSL hydrolase family protein [Thermoleophilaceae bacterium]